MTTRLAIGASSFAGLAFTLVACLSARSTNNPLMHGMENPTDIVREGCEIARDKCTRCHSMDQIRSIRVASPEAWRLYVHRMRVMPGARIHADEEPKIVQCLVYRSFGDEGLKTLQGAPQ